MSKTYIVVPDSHAHPDHNNNRADWLGKLIKDVKPDVVVNIGDTFDMPSLSSFDKGKASFYGASYEKDIEVGVEFLDRVWQPVYKTKKKRPKSIFLVGNHEQRLEKVLQYQPELGGDKYGIGWNDYCLNDYHDVVVPYDGQTYGIYQSDGISFAHAMVSGLMGRPIGGEHHAASLLAKNHSSCVVGHSHTADFAIRSTTSGKKIMGLVAGVYQDYESGWAGLLNKLWWQGVIVLRNVEDGVFDPQFISMKSMKEAYGT